MPEWMKRPFFSVFGFGENRLWQNGKATTNAGEATSLGEAAKFDRAFARTINFEYRMGNLTANPHLALRVRSPALIPKRPAICALLSPGERIEVRAIIDIGFVSRVEEEDGVVITCVVNPTLELRTRCHCARRV